MKKVVAFTPVVNALGSIRAVGIIGMALVAQMGTAVAQTQALPIARTLNIDYADFVSSADPELNNHPGNRSMSLNIYETLTTQIHGKLLPQLAQSYRNIDPLHWEFKLRHDVKWQDGQGFSAADVVFSYARVAHIPGSVATFGGFLSDIASVTTPDPYTVIITTRAPNPNLPLDLSSVAIVAKHVAEHATSADFDSGKAAIGTGPYIQTAYTPGDGYSVKANPHYWGAPPVWSKVNFHFISSAPARTAALLSGDADVIDKVSVSDIARLRSTPTVTMFDHPGLRVLLLQPNDLDASNQYVTDLNGKPLPKNPLHDPRVRRALSIAINRDAIAARLMLGAAVPAGQWMPQGSLGYNAAIPVPKQDMAEAKKLLAAAGYPNGFKLALAVPNDRYAQGPEVAQAVAQMWTRVGVVTSINSLPWAVYSGNVSKHQYAVTMLSWGNGTGEATYGMLNMLATVDAAKGRGAVNWGAYSNPKLDQDLAAATSTFDDAKREQIMEDAAKVVADDAGIIPLFHYKDVWAAKKGLNVVPIRSDRTVAQMVSPSK